MRGAWLWGVILFCRAVRARLVILRDLVNEFSGHGVFGGWLNGRGVPDS